MTRRSIALVVVAAHALAASGCATSGYERRLVARGELSVRYDDGFELWAAGKRVSRGLAWRGLADFVRCVPAARAEAEAARSDGQAALAFSALGGIMGVTAAGGLIGVVDEPHRWGWLGAGLGAAALGAVFAGLGRLYKNRANGRAIDAHNLYNDQVGALGASCQDLTYPAPAGPVP